MFKYFYALMLSVFIIIACNPKTVKQNKLTTKNSFPQKRIVQVNKENIRDLPNGYIIGKLKKGEKVLVLNKKGNWIEYDYFPDEKGYVWAPSLGYKYINLNNPTTYINSSNQQFISLSHLNNLLGQKPDTLENTGSLFNLKYSGLGLGSHTEEVLKVATLKKFKVENSVRVWFDKKINSVTEVQIDFTKSVSGKLSAIKKAKIKNNYKIIEDSESRVVLKLTNFKKPFYFILKRKEWNSNTFVGFSITNKL